METLLRFALPHASQGGLRLLERLDHAVKSRVELLELLCLGCQLTECYIEFCHDVFSSLYFINLFYELCFFLLFP